MNAFLPLDVFDAMHELLFLYRSRLRRSMEAVHPELTFNEMRVLMRVGRQPGMTQRDLVEHSHADKAQMARLLAQLQERNWLTRNTSTEDRRVRCLHLSESGKQLFGQLRSLQEQVATELLQGCEPSLQTRLLPLLQQARDIAQENADSPGRPCASRTCASG